MDIETITANHQQREDNSMNDDNDYDGLVPDVDETFAFLGYTLAIIAVAIGASIGIAGAAIVWAVQR
jgi:hypothetical protein